MSLSQNRKKNQTEIASTDNSLAPKFLIKSLVVVLLNYPKIILTKAILKLSLNSNKSIFDIQ